MARLPTVGGDNSNWGTILNEYLSVEHNPDGSLKLRTDGTLSSGIADGSITASKLSSSVNNYLASAQTAVQSVNGKTGQAVTLAAADISGVVQTSTLGAASGVATLDGSSKLTSAQLPTSVVSRSEATRYSATRNTVAAIGDSITNQNEPTGSTPGNTQLDNGYLTWANYLLSDRLDVVYIDGVPAENTSEVRARLSGFLASGAAYGCVLAGTNDLTDNRTIVQVTGDLEYIYEQALGAGMIVVAFTIFPRSDVALSADQKAVLYGVNQWIREYVAANDGMLIIDVHSKLCDPDGSTRAGMFYDDLHPAKGGAQVVGQAIADLLEPRLSPLNELLHSRADLLNILEYSPFDGTAGGVNSDPGSISGNIPVGYTLDITGGSGTLVSSMVARTDGKPGYWWRIVASGTDLTWRAYRFGRSSQFAVGEEVYSRAEFKGEGTWSGVSQFTLMAYEPGGTNYATTFQPSVSDFSGPIPQGVMRTPTKASTTAVSSARWQVQAVCDEMTISIASPELRKAT